MLDDLVPADEPTVELPPKVPEEKRPRVWTVFAAFATSLVGAIAFQAALVVIFLAWWTAQGAAPKEVIDELPKRLGGLGMFILLASCGQVAMLLTILAAARMSPNPWRERLGLLPPRSSWRVNLQAMAGSLVPLTLGFAIASPLSELLPADPTVLTLFESMTPVDWMAFILFIATVPAVIEEIMFRGYMQRRLLERWRPLAAIGVTSGLLR
jgi:membrane protease YdiL (CAAX protease family)